MCGFVCEYVVVCVVLYMCMFVCGVMYVWDSGGLCMWGVSLCDCVWLSMCGYVVCI